MRLTKKQQDILNKAFNENFLCRSWADLSTEQRNDLAEIKYFKMIEAEATHYLNCLHFKTNY